MFEDDPHSLLDTAKNALDGLSVGVTVLTFLNLLPQIAAGLTIIWTGIRIYEWWRSKH